jgi:hypothetical protein
MTDVKDNRQKIKEILTQINNIDALNCAAEKIKNEKERRKIKKKNEIEHINNSKYDENKKIEKIEKINSNSYSYSIRDFKSLKDEVNEIWIILDKTERSVKNRILSNNLVNVEMMGIEDSCISKGKVQNLMKLYTFVDKLQIFDPEIKEKITKLLEDIDGHSIYVIMENFSDIRRFNTFYSDKDKEEVFEHLKINSDESFEILKIGEEKIYLRSKINSLFGRKNYVMIKPDYLNRINKIFQTLDKIGVNNNQQYEIIRSLIMKEDKIYYDVKYRKSNELCFKVMDKLIFNIKEKKIDPNDVKNMVKEIKITEFHTWL